MRRSPTLPRTAGNLAGGSLSKTCRGSHDASRELGALHIISAWAGEEGIALGQVATEEKSNEITAIPGLLELISQRQAIQ